MRAIVFAAALLACPPASAADAAQAAAASFYRTYAALRAGGGMTGVPDQAHLAKLAPFLTPELRRLLAAARAEQVRCGKRFPGEKPPWIDGDLFSSNFEGFTSFQAEASKAGIDAREVTVRFRYAAGTAKVDWADELVLRNATGRWRVDDVFYRAKFAFTSGFGSNLRASLGKIPAC